jgi:hypothetical protein
MGVLDYADIDVQALMDYDDKYAQDLDARKGEVAATIEEGRKAVNA